MHLGDVHLILCKLHFNLKTNTLVKNERNTKIVTLS